MLSRLKRSLCRRRNHLGGGQLAVPPFHELRDGRLAADVDLVDDHYHRAVDPRELVEVFGVLVGGLHRVGHIEDHVGVAQGFVDGIHHVLLQAVAGAEYARVSE